MLRYNPLLNTYTMVAANRQNRPNMPQGWCPFCIGSGKVPDEGYTVLMYPNDFPALSPQANEVLDTPLPNSPYQAEQSLGHCEVILYSPDHHASLHDLSLPHLEELIALWQNRHQVMAADTSVKYIFIFENRGEAVGVTMPHPHGQIYGYPFVPLKLVTQLQNCKTYYDTHQRPLLADMLATELADGRRLIFENTHFVAYIPYFTDYPYGVMIQARRHLNYLSDFNAEETRAFAEILKAVTGGMDKLFDTRFPYMMCFHQNPVNTPEWEGHEVYFSFHVEFYTPWRAKNVIKYYASSETGAWAAANTRLVEETAPELRQAIQDFMQGKEG